MQNEAAYNRGLASVGLMAMVPNVRHYTDNNLVKVQLIKNFLFYELDFSDWFLDVLNLFA